MTQDEIIEIVREAGGSDVGGHGWTTWVGTQSTEFLERFANLVAAKEREACAKVAEQNTEPHYKGVIEDVQKLFHNKREAQPEQEPVAWLLTDKNINSLQVDSIQRLIDGLKHAHHTDVCVRINGQDEWFQADWLKHMVRGTPPQRTQPNDIDLFWRAVTTPEKWVGLTAEEVLQCWERAHKPENKEHINAIRMADEVEQALKEKNCG